MPDEPSAAGYRRSTGSPRGEARRIELLGRVAEDLAANGLADFSLRRAARAADTTHKVLLYHFESADHLLVQAILLLRQQRIERGLAAAGPTIGSLSDRVRAIWPVLTSGEAQVLDQAIGLAMSDPARHHELARQAADEYLPSLLSICPPSWSDQRKVEVSFLILATLRGFIVDLRTAGDPAATAAGFEALLRALDREEAAES